MQMLPPTGQPMTLTEQRNSRWRRVAEYERWVMPLYLYLENIDWQKVASWYADLWHRQFVRSFHYYKEDWGGYYRGGMYRNSRKPGGRLIQRDRLYAGTKFRIRLVLPIPTPLEYAQRRVVEGVEFYREVLAKIDADTKEVTPDARKYLADRLRSASTRLGRIEKPNWNDSSTWKPDWQLEQAVEPEGAGRRFQSLQQNSLGQLLATVEHFWLCWRDFHEAEKEVATESVSVRPTVTPALLTDSAPLTHLHPTIQKAAASLFASIHYPQAILAACTALDKAVQARAQLPASTVGTTLMTTAFSAKAPIIQLSHDANEQMGFMNLYQGSVQAIRNHYAHNLTEIPAARALEWLSFLSALFYKLDEAQPTVVASTP
jgi:uncharacterized protein (TIGR02391 family)